MEDFYQMVTNQKMLLSYLKKKKSCRQGEYTIKALPGSICVLSNLTTIHNFMYFYSVSFPISAVSFQSKNSQELQLFIAGFQNPSIIYKATQSGLVITTRWQQRARIFCNSSVPSTGHLEICCPDLEFHPFQEGIIQCNFSLKVYLFYLVKKYICCPSRIQQGFARMKKVDSPCPLLQSSIMSP